jgi:hypothetical protein
MSGAPRPEGANALDARAVVLAVGVPVLLVVVLLGTAGRRAVANVRPVGRPAAVAVADRDHTHALPANRTRAHPPRTVPFSTGTPLPGALLAAGAIALLPILTRRAAARRSPVGRLLVRLPTTRAPPA